MTNGDADKKPHTEMQYGGWNVLERLVVVSRCTFQRLTQEEKKPILQLASSSLSKQLVQRNVRSDGSPKGKKDSDSPTSAYNIKSFFLERNNNSNNNIKK
jgi:hypothetical protein